MIATGLLGAVVLAAAALATFRYLPAADDARALRSDLEDAVARIQHAGLDVDDATLDVVATDLAKAHDRLDRLSGLLSSDPIVGLARILPPTARQVAGADDIAAAARDLLRAADGAFPIARRFVAIKGAHDIGGSGGSTPEALLALMAESRDATAAATNAVANAKAALARAPEGLVGPLQSARDAMSSRLEQFGPLLDQYVAVSARLPSILGWDRPRRYLLLTQDPAEIRPTGGYIGSFGIVEFNHARVTERRFQDMSLDYPFDYPFIEPPQELIDDLLGNGQPWQLSDANWSPDFPTSAQNVIRLYANESGDTRIDGVIAVTTDTIDELLKVTGPITIPEYGVTIAPGETALKVLQVTRESRAPGESRKAFLPVFADRLFTALLALPVGRWPELPGLLDTFRREHLLQAWFIDAGDQSLVEQTGYAGQVRQDRGDYVYAVDSNVAPVSKLNLVTTRSLDLAVALDAVGNAHDTLVASWTNTVESPGAAAYRKMTNTGGHTLGMYFRLLAPDRTRIESVSGGGAFGVDQPASVGQEAGRAVIGTYLRVPPGSASLRVAWTSPYAAEMNEQGWLYRLTVQRQPGVRAGPIRITIRVPDGYRITAASPTLVVSDTMATLTDTFDEDLVLGVRYVTSPAG